LSNEHHEIIVDAKDMVVGRIASIVAKKLLLGYRVNVINVEKAVFTGTKERVLDNFKKKLSIQSKVNPRRHGPFKPRTPEGIFRRVVRGMLPRKKSKGKDALRRLRVYRGIPSELENKDIIIYREAVYKKSPYGKVSIEEISRLLGWKPIEEKVR
jgi:large subunit ribosomal protein L13